MIVKEVHGTFNGQLMESDDGTLYPVSSNYASKSKLVAGDGLVLKIRDDGEFIFKQVDLVPRRRTICEMVENDKKRLVAYSEELDKTFNVLEASISYYQLQVGTSVTLIIPAENEHATWGAIEHVIEE